MLRRKRLAIGGVVLAAAFGLAACTPGSGTDEGATTSAADAKKIDVASLGDVTLRVWDQEVRGSQNEQMTKLNEAFMAKYPNVTIERNSQSFDDLNKTLGLALTDKNPPDVVQANNARNTMGEFVKAKQIQSLDPWAKLYGWTDRYPESILAYSSYSPDGKTFGSGEVYGLPQVGEVVGVFYNKAKLADLGLKVPTTWDEWTKQMGTAKSAGVTPLMLGDQEQWPGLHVFGPVQGAHTGYDEIKALAMGNKADGASWTDADNLAAATEFSNWVKSGYLNSGALGTTDEAAREQFQKGDSLFYLAGSWNVPDLQDAMKDNVGFFSPPPVKAGDPVATTGGTGLPFAITSKAANPDLAAAYIDFITNDDANQVQADVGNLPIRTGATLPADAKLLQEVYAAYGDVTENGHILPYLDYATPTFADTIGAGLQDLIAGKKTPEQFTQALQDDYSAFVESNA